MDDATPPAAPGPDPDLEPVDGALAASLLEQGEDGARALGLLRDAYRMLGDDSYEQQAEIAESCVRNAVDALLSLPGSQGNRPPPGLQSTARTLLKAVDAYQPHDEQPTAGKSKGTRRSRDPQAALRRIRQAADALRPELERPGGYHRRRAMGVAERLMGQRLGAAQESALDAWGEIYGATSNVLHGNPSSQARTRYRQVLRLAREVFVPLPGRAAQVLELTDRQNPTPEDAETLSGWADPRAVRYFFLSRPAAGWLELLDEVWLLPDATSPEGHWPAAPYLDHLTEAAPQQARAWLAERAERVAAAGPEATRALLRLAARPGIGLNRQVRAVVSALTREARESGAADGWLLRLAADWARDIPLAERDEDWIRTVEMLLAEVVRAEHQPDQEIPAAEGADLPDDEIEERIARRFAGQLPDYEAAMLLVAVLHTAYPSPRSSGGGQAHGQLPLIRTVLAALLRADAQRTDPAILHTVVFHRDLDQVALEHPEAFFGPLLARAVLDLAAADAHAGVPLGERTEALVRQVGKTDERLRDRLLAAHLQQLPPDTTRPNTPDAEAWWAQATRLLPALLAHRPTPEGARLLAYLNSNCPPQTAPHLTAQMTDAFGAPPGPEKLAGYDPASADRPPRAWLRVWDWSPVLPEAVLTLWQPVLTLLRRAKPSGPADPRTAGPFVQITDAPRPVVDETQAAAIAAEHGPAAAAAALATAPDAGDPRYLMVLRTLIEDDRAAWTTQPAEITARLALPALRAFYLSIAADQTRHRDAFPAGALAEAVMAALADTTTTDAPAAGTDPDDDQPSTAGLTEQALIDLVFAAWRTGTDLGANLPAVLDHLYNLTAPLTTPAGTTSDDTSPGTLPADFVGTDPAGRAVHCLLEHARHQRSAPGDGLPARLLHHLTTIIEATGTEPRTTAALGPYLPLLHHRARDWIHNHRTVLLPLPADSTPTAASAWLRWGPAHPPLLADLDRAELLSRLRTSTPPGAASHMALALLDDPHVLGDPAALFTELAAADGGPAAASRLLDLLAHHTAHATDTAVQLWRAALSAGMPPGAMAGAGTFALTDIDEATWLDLTLASARHTPALRNTDHIAERAAHHPDKPAAAQLATLLVAHPSTDPWRDATVRQHARRLLAAIGQLPPATELERPTQELRDALITAGDIEAHQL
ncbi:hypothetical protein OG889_45145 [Streptomyces sp. NBC_00481]|uniref:hypothetical protein n=1 Tax=Streptomyces sp. NBC_00481 TaxID=2975755 RepID=UPI002DD868CD|nr:hypothetical protein [Streptomyces sp. NBC_00481]WRZ01235.1 hypothetical protein OG889_45145 [Streptomyces sp. NBC_00481]